MLKAVQIAHDDCRAKSDRVWLGPGPLQQIAADLTDFVPNHGLAPDELTAAGEDLRDVIMSLGGWGQRWIESSLTLRNLDPSLLMWDMRRNIASAALPDRRCTVLFVYPELGTGRKQWWLVMESGEVDLCAVDPGHDVDLYVHGLLRSMTAVWMGISTLEVETSSGTIKVTGDPELAQSMGAWLGLSPFATEQKLAS